MKIWLFKEFRCFYFIHLSQILQLIIPPSQKKRQASLKKSNSHRESTFRCVFNFRYSMEDLTTEQKYLVNLNIQICLEANKPCLIDVPVFKNTKLPKKPCEWRTEFLNDGKLYLILSNLPTWLILKYMYCYWSLSQ